MLARRHPDFEDIVIVEHAPHFDDRGQFVELYKHSDVSEFLPPSGRFFAQDNCSVSVLNVFRGFHFQPKQGKFVSCPLGTVIDYFIDLRRRSKDFKKIGSIVLNALRSVWIPPGFGHGFHVFSSQAVVAYKLTSEYAQDIEGGVNPLDPALNVPEIENLSLSDRDKNLPRLEDFNQELE
jgi:dTDP-4-dehydrorhamnose 3,5-epimerase